jgi:hypothetical protein
MLVEMCHYVYVSTSSPEDLSQIVGKHARFDLLSDAVEEDVAASHHLHHDYKWMLNTTPGGCSCDFRHCFYGEMVFQEPEVEYEGTNEIEGTLEVYDIFSRIVSQGYDLDVVIFNSFCPRELTQKDVSLSTVARETFRFFDLHRFMIRA